MHYISDAPRAVILLSQSYIKMMFLSFFLSFLFKCWHYLQLFLFVILIKIKYCLFPLAMPTGMLHPTTSNIQL